ncbi:hypothetical protein TrST_g9639 [Triparma strigata]|uniref:Vesicle transport protein n=1 Tax=Triparma strigata TaxID=1606541 RepID=A0A9W6ZVV9_9STRA|nr:hypothetical protein TrST_g9639 [Triparma strigata]
MNDLQNQVKGLLNPTREKTWNEQLEEEVCSVFPALSYTQRLTGCLCCMALGFLLSFGSFLRFSKLLHGDATPFAVCFTIGSIIALTGTCFLSGPQSQMKKMCKKTRAGASAMYILSIIGTLGLAFYGGDIKGQAGLLVICVLIQYTAIIWYTLSYIPYARDMVKSCCKSKFCGEEMC